MYDHTRIASYWHLRVGNVGSKYDYWLLEGNACSAAGVFQVTLFCPGLRQTVETEARVWAWSSSSQTIGSGSKGCPHLEISSLKPAEAVLHTRHRRRQQRLTATRTPPVHHRQAVAARLSTVRDTDGGSRGCPLRETLAESCRPAATAEAVDRRRRPAAVTGDRRASAAAADDHRRRPAAVAEAVDCRRSSAVAAVADLREATGSGGRSCQLQEEEKLSSFFPHFYLSMRQFSNWRNYFRPLGLRLCSVVMIIYCVYD